jgi:hypothetical protein
MFGCLAGKKYKIFVVRCSRGSQEREKEIIYFKISTNQWFNPKDPYRILIFSLWVQFLNFSYTISLL